MRHPSSFWCFTIQKKRKYPVRGRVSFKEGVKAFRDGIWALIMPLLLVSGIIFGVFTVTELAAVTVIYGLVVGVVVYKSLKLKDIPRIMGEVAVDTGVIMFVIGTTTLFSWVLTMYQVPQAVSASIATFVDNKIVLLILINVLFLFAGMLLDSTPATLMLVPILLPAVKAAGIDLTHFGVVIVFNMMLGLLTPPVGICLMLCAQMGKVSIYSVFKEVIPFFILGILILILITYVPSIVTFLPNLLIE